MINEPTGALYQTESNSPPRWDMSGYGWSVQWWGRAVPWGACDNVDIQEVTAAVIGVRDSYMERNSFLSQLHKWGSLHFRTLLQLCLKNTLKDHDHLLHDLFTDIAKQCEWMHLAQDRDQGQAPVNMVMNPLVQKKGGISW